MSRKWRRREIVIDGEIAYVPLTQGMTAIVDAEDAPRLLGRSWCAKKDHGNIYAISKDYSVGRERTVYMHRVLMNAEPSVQIDHKNGDGLDNRKANLRPATQKQNMHNQRLRLTNTSGFKGVYQMKDTGRWRARIHVDGRKINLGCYATAEEAGAAYNKASAEMHGEFFRPTADTAAKAVALAVIRAHGG